MLEIAAAYREVSSAISEKIAQEMIDNKRTEILEKSTEDRASALADFQKVLAGSLSGSTADMIRSQTMGFVDDMIAAGKDVDTVTTSIVQSIHRQYKQIGTGDLSEAKEALRDYVKAVKSDADKIESVQKRLGSLVRTPKKKPANELDEVVVTPSVEVARQRMQRTKKSILRKNCWILRRNMSWSVRSYGMSFCQSAT